MMARTNATAQSIAQTIMTAAKPLNKNNGARITGARAYPKNLVLLKTERDVPLISGQALTLIVSMADQTKLVPTPSSERKTRKDA